MIRVAVLAPVLGRPARAEPLAESLAASYQGRLFDLRIRFLASPDDHAQSFECARLADLYPDVVALTVMEFPAGAGDYARKINVGWRLERRHSTEFVFLGADDLVFHPGWIEQAVAVQLDTGACVIGTNDLYSRGSAAGTAATHSLVHVDYDCGTIDDPNPGLLLHEGYDHNFVDNEFVGTAQYRGVYAHAPHARVEHLHPYAGKAVKDSTYAKGERMFSADRELHRRRAPLWKSTVAIV